MHTLFTLEVERNYHITLNRFSAFLMCAPTFIQYIPNTLEICYRHATHS